MVAPVPKDFFSQTANLLLTNQKSGQYRPYPKPCGGCGTTKRRKPEQDFDLQFVWPFIASEAQGDEIRFSVRSVEKFFDGRAKCTIIGDRPPWFTGHVIRKKRVPESTPKRSYRDMLSKVWFMATHAEIDSEFVWMMDDIYFLRPFTFEEVAVPRAERFHRSSANTWQRIKAETMDELTSRGLTNHDYATHAPHVADKEKLRLLFDDFDLHHKTLTWELIYGNLYRETPERSRPFMSRIGKHMSMEQISHVTRNSTVLNHTSSAWCKGMRDYLLALMPDAASVENKEQNYKPTYVARRVNRDVKRRSVETHRGYVPAIAESQPAIVQPVPHIMIIQSAYANQRLSGSRLEIARHTAIASLTFQSVKPVIHITVNPADPWLEARLDAFRSTGCEVKPLYRSEWKLYKEDWELPEGRKIVGRMDDDDVICRDYCKELREAAPATGEWNLVFPVGYTWWRNTAYQLEHMGNQFVTLVTGQMTDPHQEGHWRYHKIWQTKIVSHQPSWIWVRHGDASTSTLKRYRKQKRKGIDAARIPINLRAVQRTIEPTGKPSGTYNEHGNQTTLRAVFRENNIHAGTPVPLGFEEVAT